METMVLLGAEHVQRAGFVIDHAAQQMSNVSSNLQIVLEANQWFLDDWLRRFEEIIDRQVAAIRQGTGEKR